MKGAQTAYVVTGAGGFIGAAIVRVLIACGHRVFVLSRPQSDLSRLSRAGPYIPILADRLDDPALPAQLREERVVAFIHCAWRGVAGGDRNEPWQISENVPLSIAAALLAADCGCRHFIGIGSQAEYGNLNCVIAESAPTSPTTVYGKAKLAAGIATLALCESRGLSASWVRIFSIYGPGDAPHWFIQYIIREFAAGRAPKLTRCEQLWDYLHVADAAEAITSLAEKRAHGIFNLGHGRAWSLREIVETIQTAMGVKTVPEYGAIPYRPDQVMHLEADISKLTAATGWRPRIGLVEGISETVNYFLEHQ